MSLPHSTRLSTEALRNRTGLADQWSALSPRVRGVLTWFGVFIGVVILKRDALLLPASWDESWAVLPGGLWLSDNGFDILGLIRQPQWFEYGPGSYALAPLTWMTGIVAIFAKSTTSFLLSLHLIHMAIGAVGLREVYRFARPVWTATASAGLVLVTALVPVMNAQLGFMYLEIPIFTAGMLAVNAGLAGKWGRASAWGALATSFKGSGILPISAVVGAVLVTQGSLASLRKSALVVFPALLVGLLPILLSQPLAAPDRDLGVVFYASTVQMVRMPELAIALVFAIAFTALPDHRGEPVRPAIQDRMATFSWIVLSFIGFYIITILFIIPIYVLPRYFSVIVPFVLFAAWEAGTNRFGYLIPSLFATLLVGSMIVNSSGSLIGNGDAISSVGLEVSNEYATRLLLTRDTLHQALATGDPVYLIPNLWFRSQYPRLGYVDEVPANIFHIEDLDAETLPDRFVIVDTAINRVAGETRDLLNTTSEFEADTTELKRDGLTAQYVTYSRKSG